MHLSGNRKLFLTHLAQTSGDPLMLEVERAEGVFLFAPDGRRYLDMISGIAVSALGHNHPAIVEAVVRQAERHMHVMVYGEIVQSPQTQLAERLMATLPPSLDRVFLVNSGTEATEGAVKLARRYTGRPDIVSCKKAYHGSSQGALSLTDSEAFTGPFRPLVPGVRFMRYGVQDDLSVIDSNTAGVIVETVQGEAGVRIADKAFFKALKRRCAETGALLLLDEIQCGFGRTGSFWAFEQYEIEPDILLTAKAMGGGMPIGAFIAGDNIMSVLKHDPALGHITTFGGHPVSAAASVAAIDTILNTGLHTQAADKGAALKTMLQHPAISEIRQIGLMMALQFDTFDTVQRIIKSAQKLGLITDWFLFCDSAIRVAPPLTIDSDTLRLGADILLEAIEEGTKHQ
jgi:acetylornithine/succinyldiaminopimelate/putrescine aminotransferase